MENDKDFKKQQHNVRLLSPHLGTKENGLLFKSAECSTASTDVSGSRMQLLIINLVCLHIFLRKY